MYALPLTVTGADAWQGTAASEAGVLMRLTDREQNSGSFRTA